LRQFLKLERQHIVFIAAAATAFAILIGLAYYNPFQQLIGDDSSVTKVRKGEVVNIRYSSNVGKMIHDLPARNALEAKVSSELLVTNVAGIGGEFRYNDMTITYVQDGKEETVTPEEFRTIEYRFFPDRGNTTKYLFENVDYIAKTDNNQLIVSVKPLSNAKVGERYIVGLTLHTGNPIGYSIGNKVIEIIS
jgi:hypothetical protein